MSQKYQGVPLNSKISLKKLAFGKHYAAAKKQNVLVCHKARLQCGVTLPSTKGDFSPSSYKTAIKQTHKCQKAFPKSCVALHKSSQ